MKTKAQKFLKLCAMTFLITVSTTMRSQLCGGYVDPTPVLGAQQNCTSNSNAYNTKYRLQSTFVPTTNDPLITVKLTFHVFNSNANNVLQGYQGSGSHLTQMNNIVGFFQNGYDRYSTQRNASYDQSFISPFTGNAVGNSSLMDSRVRYEVTNVYYYSNPPQSILTSNSGSNLIDYVNLVAPGRIDEGLPIFFNLANFQYTGYASAYQGKPFVHTNITPGGSDYFVNQHLRHEIGHCAGWHHVYSGVTNEFISHPCNSDNYLSDVFPPTGTICNSNNACNSCLEPDVNPSPYISNNVMNLVPFGNYDNTWTSPLQMGRRIKNLHLPHNGLRHYVKWMDSQQTNPWQISNSETWDFDIQTYKDIVVKSGATLSLTCKVAMAKNGKIIVEKNARLVLDNALITTWCNGDFNGLWRGIEVDGDQNAPVSIDPVTGLDPNRGIVEIKNGSEISYAQFGVYLSKTTNNFSHIGNTSGGHLIVDNSTFLNNVYDIAIWQNPLCQAKITNSIFRTNGYITKTLVNGSVVEVLPEEHIKLMEAVGVEIEGCLFENTLYGTNQTVPGVGAGIYATNSTFSVDQFCINNNCTSPVRTTFRGLERGIHCDNTNPLFNHNITNSSFYNNYYGILANNTENMVISDNYFEPFGINNTGVYMYKSKNYNIRENSILGTQSSLNNTKGIVTYDSRDGAHFIYGNSLQKCYAAVLAMDDNSGLTNYADGLKINCNNFNPSNFNEYDVAVAEWNQPPSVMQEQSPFGTNDPEQLVRNIYGAPYIDNTVQNKWYVASSSTKNIIHGSNLELTTQPDQPNPQSSSQVWVNPTNISLDYEEDCDAFPPSTGKIGQPEFLSELNAYIASLQTTTTQNVWSKKAAVSSKLNYFMGTPEAWGIDSALTILNTNQGEMSNADILVVFAHMHKRDFVTAQAKINQLPSSRADWSALLAKLVDLESREGGLMSLKNDVTSQSFLRGYAETEGRDGQGVALAALNAVLGERYEVPMVVLGGSHARQFKKSVEETGTSIDVDLISTQIRVYPNPVDDVLTIESNYSDLKLSVSDVIGREILTTFITKNNNSISTKSLMPGVYTLSVSDKNNNILKKIKIVKN